MRLCSVNAILYALTCFLVTLLDFLLHLCHGALLPVWHRFDLDPTRPDDCAAVLRFVFGLLDGR